MTRRIVAEDTAAAFECRDPGLGEFLAQQALRYEAIGFARTYVLTQESEPQLCGFYSLSAGRVQFTDLPEEAARDLPRHPLPMLLLARLARDSRSAKGSGEVLLKDALDRALDIAELIGCWGVLLDAKNEDLIQYYERFGFMRTKRTAVPQQMILPLATVRDAAAPASLH